MNANTVLFSTVTFFSTLLGGIFAAKYRKNPGILAAFASGVLIAVSLFDLLPESIKLAAQWSVPLEDVMYAAAS